MPGYRKWNFIPMLSRLALLAPCAILGAPASAQLATPATPEAIEGTWKRVDASTGRISEVGELEELARQFPHSGSVHLRLLNAYLAAEQYEHARALADWIVDMGYEFSDKSQAELTALLTAHGEDDRLDLAGADPGPIEVSTVVAVVPAEIELVESVLRERNSGLLYVTAIVSPGLFRQDGDGAWRRVDLGPVGSLSGIVQAPDGRVWAASGVYEQTPEPETAFRGLVGYDPSTGDIRRIAAPAGASPADLAVGPDGTLYASDPLSGAVYSAVPSTGTLSVLLSPGTLRSPQGLAPSSDGRLLYVSDYRYGLAVIDLRSGIVDRLPSSASPWLDGTDGLWMTGQTLVAIQNGTSPPRIVTHDLAPDGRSIVRTYLKENAHPQWTEPLGGHLTGRDLIYVATGQWDRFGEGGAVLDGKSPEPTEIRLLDLNKSQPQRQPKNPG